jgi:hypothetical protein
MYFIIVKIDYFYTITDILIVTKNMERHQQTRMEQSSLLEKLEQKYIKIEDFVSEMRILNKELGKVEQKMYKELDNSISKYIDDGQKDCYDNLDDSLVEYIPDD